MNSARAAASRGTDAPSPSSTAKNVILAGVRAVTVHDQKAVELRDLSAQFYLAEDDVGQNRAEACKDKLQELNTAVAVTASAAELTPEFVGQFQVRGVFFARGTRVFGRWRRRRRRARRVRTDNQKTPPALPPRTRRTPTPTHLLEVDRL